MRRRWRRGSAGERTAQLLDATEPADRVRLLHAFERDALRTARRIALEG
jgi:hypothetical protein